MRRFVIALILCSPLLLWCQSDTTTTVFGESGIFTIDANDPVVDWLNPDIGDNFLVNESFAGTWDATDEALAITPVTIYYSIGIGSFFTVVADNLPDNSATTLTAPAAATDFLRIAIRVSDQFGNSGWDYTQGYIDIGDGSGGDTTAAVSDVSADFTIDTQEPSVTLTSPDAVEVFDVGESVPCTWTASDNSFGVAPIALGIASIIGDSISVLVSDIGNTGSAAFIMPDVETRFGRVFVIAKDEYGNKSYDGSDQYLTFGNPASLIDSITIVSDISSTITVDVSDPFVELYTPNGGETYLEETNFNVSWNASDELLDSDPVTIFMSTTIGGIFELQADLLIDDGLEVITAPLGPVDFGQIRVTARDHYGNVGQDQSDGYFTVFESGNGAIQGDLHIDRAINGILYLDLWLPGHDPEIHVPDREQPPFPVDFNAGDTLLYSFANLLPGSGYSVRAFIDKSDSDNSGNDSCDYGYDLSGYYTLITVFSDIVTSNIDIDLVECENYNNGDFSLNFGGINDYVEIPDASGLNPDTAFTICTWVKPQLWNSTEHLVHKGIGNSQYSLKADSNQFVFEINGTTSIYMSLPPLGVWTFICAVYKNDRLNLYGNGILQSTVDFTGTLNTGPDPLIIGRRTSGSPAADSFNGLMDYISIWSRGLTAAEIITAMENGVDSVSANDLTGYWNFVEGVANTIHDESNSGNNGQIYGATWDNTVHMIEPDLSPVIPLNFNVNSGDHSVYLNWSINPEYDISHYDLFRSTSAVNPHFGTQVSHPGNTYTDQNVENGQTYYYWISTVDLTGNASDTVGAISVVPNGPPTWTGLVDTSFYEDDSLVLIIAPYIYDDSDHDSTLSISVTGDGAILFDYNSSTSQLKLWADPDASGFSDLIYLSATDPFGLTAQDSFNVSVIPVNDPPVITSSSSANAVEGFRFVYLAEAQDPDDTVFGWTFTDLPSWLSTDADSLFGIPYENAPDTSFSIHLTDGELTDSTVVEVLVEHVDNRPIITSSLTAFAVEDEYFIYQAGGFDPEDSTINWIFTDLPAWLNSAADSVFGIPLEGTPNSSFQMIVSDGNLEATATVQVMVEPVNDRPAITSPSLAVAVEDQFFYYICQANDPEDSTITWTYPDLPAWLTAIADSVFGVAEESDINTTFTIIADDGELSDSLIVAVSIEKVNDPPVVELIIDVSEKHDQFDFTVSTWDEEEDLLTVEITYSQDNISWLEPDISTSDNLTYTWNSVTDFGDQYRPQVWLKVECSDTANTTIEISQPFAVDNHIGTLELNLITAGLEFSDQIEIPFQIYDSTADIYALESKFSIDGGLSWQPATVTGMVSGIGPVAYNSSLIWMSDSDLPGDYLETQLKVIPSDDWQPGRGDTISILLDNQALPVLVDHLPQLAEEVDWHSPFQLEFSLPMEPQTFANGIQVIGDYQGLIPVSFSYDSNNNTVTINPENWYYATDSIRIALNFDLQDVTGDPFDANGNGQADGPADLISIPFGVGLLADFDHSGSVNFDDLVEFRNNWLDGSPPISDEIGPATGIPPLMQIQPDSSFDFEDMMVFVQMWNWSAGFGNNQALLAKSAIGSEDLMDISISYSRRTSPTSPEYIDLGVVLDSAVVMGALATIINYDPNVLDLEKISYNLDNNWVKLSHVGQEAQVVINLADLNRNPDQPVSIPFGLRFLKKSTQQTSINLQADIRNRNGGIIATLNREFQFDTTPPIPEDYALHQNYPNPFNPTTRINFELPKDNQVKLTVHNLLGQEVAILVNSWQPAGYHNVQWNGLNKAGRTVSGGVYLLRMEAGSFSAIRKLTLLK